MIANVINGFPARNLKVIGVTGTDGKTSTSTMIYSLLNDAGIRTGLMSTIGYGVPDNWHDNYIHMTTVSSFELMKRIKELKRDKIEWLVLETTSHALAQNRIWGVPYSIAVMTNVTHEHLDYHRTFERYRDAKKRLFEITGRNPEGMRAGVINADDPSAELFALSVRRSIRYGIEKGDLRASKLKLAPTGNDFEARYHNIAYNLHTNLPGKFNVYNAMAAAGVGILLDLSPKQIEKGIASLATVEGRMNSIDEGQDFSVIVDFAHTPDSFEKILSQMKELTKGRLIVVFGSAGRRDEAKRPLQGASAGKWADLVVITEEDDRDVDGKEIMEQIARGAEKEGKKRNKDLFLIHDRSEAIAFAINQAKKDDTAILLGKGHEKTIERADGEHPWDELGEARKALRNRK